jgi:hypothetical protein
MIPDSEQKMIEGQGKLINRRTKTAGKDYDRFFIYVPTELARDGLFPFKEGEKISLKIDSKNGRLLIEKAKHDETK